MADTIRETIVAAAEAALNAAGKPTGLKVHRFPTRALDRDDLPAMAIYHLVENVELDTHAPSVNRKLMIRIEHRVKTLVTSEDPPDKTLDPFIAWGTKGLLANAALAALVISIEEKRITWEAFEADSLYAGAAQDFEIEYATVESDQETAA